MSIFGKLFGQQGRKGPHIHAERRHAISPELWNDPKLGGFLRHIGASPNDPSNLIPTEQEIADRVSAAQAAVEKRTEERNRELRQKAGADRQVVPFFLIGDGCWNGDFGHFLTHQLDFTPYDEWNVAYLAADAETSALFGIPPHPYDRLIQQEQICEEYIRREKARLDALYKNNNNFEDVLLWSKAKNQTKQNIKDLAGKIHSTMIDGHNRHKRKHSYIK
jgi:hypothetical protein